MKILDVCCGSRMFWYDKEEPHTTYMDIRKAVYTAMALDYRCNLNRFCTENKKDAPSLERPLKINKKVPKLIIS